ncbi:MAG: inositol monophosphatase family protein, partial [Sulfitobacter sp.]
TDSLTLASDYSLLQPYGDAKMVAEHIVKDGLGFVELAADIAHQFFRKTNAVSFKSDQSPVTVADQTIERAMRDAIKLKYPDHGIFGEEYGISSDPCDEMWVIDPIDGTRSFLSGFPLYGVLLAHLKAGQPQFGIIKMPALNEVYCGVTGDKATLNGAPIRVSEQTTLDKAILYVNEGDKIYHAHPDVFDRLVNSGQTRRFSNDCYPHALLASGHVDAVVDYDLKPYDFLALAPVIEAAGGVITTWTGDPVHLEYEGPVVCAATAKLHSQLIDLLAD